MVPQGQQLVLSLEQSVPATSTKPSNLTTLGGYIDYTAIRTSVLVAGKFLWRIVFTWFKFLQEILWLSHVWGFSKATITPFLRQKPRHTISLEGRPRWNVCLPVCKATSVSGFILLSFKFSLFNSDAVAARTSFRAVTTGHDWIFLIPKKWTLMATAPYMRSL